MSMDHAELRYAVTPITHVEVRDPSGNPDDTWTMSGYAAVFNQSTILFDSKFVRLSESIDPGSSTRSCAISRSASPTASSTSTSATT
jgi:phage head maturation protease